MNTASTDRRKDVERNKSLRSVTGDKWLVAHIRSSELDLEPWSLGALEPFRSLRSASGDKWLVAHIRGSELDLEP